MRTGTGSRAESSLTGRFHSLSFLRELAKRDFKQWHRYLTMFALFLIDDLEHSFFTVVCEQVIVLNLFTVILFKMSEAKKAGQLRQPDHKGLSYWNYF
jgi:hypothetical protein